MINEQLTNDILEGKKIYRITDFYDSDKLKYPGFESPFIDFDYNEMAENLPCFEQRFFKHMFDTPCVYFLTQEKNNKHKIVYIGSTKRLANRICQHKDGQAGRSGKCYIKEFDGFRVMFVKKEEMLDIENILIGVYQPIYNIKLNRGYNNYHIKKVAEHLGKDEAIFREQYADNKANIKYIK